MTKHLYVPVKRYKTLRSQVAAIHAYCIAHHFGTVQITTGAVVDVECEGKHREFTVRTA